MSKQRLRNREWLKLRRKYEKNLKILAEEEYFDNITKRYDSYLNTKCCNDEEQQFVYEDQTDSNNEYYDENNDQFNTDDSLERTDGICFALSDKEGSVHEALSAEADNASYTLSLHIANISCETSLRHFECQNHDNSVSDNITTSDTLYEQRTNFKENTNCEAENSDMVLAQDLRVWAVRKNVTLISLSLLLTILRKNNHKYLPLCAQTLLRTPRSTTSLIRELEGGGQFWYSGILSGLKSILSRDQILETTSDIIEIDVFFDGFSPYNSIRRILWPIAGCIAGSKEVFIIALWCGESKCPSNLDAYLEDFINEVLELRNGFNIENRNYKLKIRNIIADAPARAWLKCVNQHGSKFACERCTVTGMWFGNRMTYPSHEEAPLRTNESVCQQIHKEYHKGISPLITRLQLEPVTQFPLESFHLLYLGIMKRILSRLYCAKTSKYKLPRDIILQIDNFFIFLRSFFSSDFARRPRRLRDWKYYKGTEFRRLLLYDGFLIFRFMHREVHKNFLLFACAIRILVDPVLIKDYAVDADKLLRLFVEHSSNIYGQTFVVYNVHHLIHIAADCLLHGHLEEFSAFKFESFLGCMKNYLHAPGNALPQIVCRVMEKAAALRYSYATKKELLFEQHHNTGPTLNCQGQQYKKVRMSNKYFHVQSTDAYCLTKANEVLKIENIIKCTEGNYLISRKFTKKSDLFLYPFSSNLIDIYIVSTLGPLHRWCLDDIKRKVVLLPLSEKNAEGNRISKSVSFPMPHSEIL